MESRNGKVETIGEQQLKNQTTDKLPGIKIAQVDYKLFHKTQTYIEVFLKHPLFASM